ncbi:hypothetical protein EIP91_011006 [Steccherinum ochraceum]|uniref:Uncharacterized protein n=1 Tax=Steccherinum ochraceum TaxID=92696 RepID=A0A4R0R587_9APHY|nr:hypothetical protein EIP91_011006 [Steccherinum ochraceum]
MFIGWDHWYHTLARASANVLHPAAIKNELEKRGEGDKLPPSMLRKDGKPDRRWGPRKKAEKPVVQADETVARAPAAPPQQVQLRKDGLPDQRWGPRKKAAQNQDSSHPQPVGSGEENGPSKAAPTRVEDFPTTPPPGHPAFSGGRYVLGENGQYGHFEPL